MAESPVSTHYGMKDHWRCLLSCSVVALTAMLYGGDVIIIDTLQAMPGFLEVFGNRDPTTPIGYNISPLRQQLFGTLLVLGNIVSSALSGVVSHYIGRRASIWVGCVFLNLGTALMMVVNTIGGMYAARFLVGVAHGLLYTFFNLYLQECSPARYRGLLLSISGSALIFGSLVGSIIANYSVKLPGRQQYQIPLGASLVISVIFMFGGIFTVPESPRWLLLQNKEDKARKSLKALKPKKESEESINIELLYMKTAIDEEKRLAQGVAFMDIFRHPVDRRRTLLVVGTSILSPITGITWHATYGTYMFQMAGIKKPFEQSVGLAASAVGFSILTSLAITRMGYRRPWLVTGLLICAACNIVMAASYSAHPGSRESGIVTITMFHLFNLGYIGMVLTFSRLTCGELPSQRLRAMTLGLAFCVASFGEWVSSFIAPYFLNPDALNWNAKFAYLWTPGCVLGAIWVYIYLPEVKDRNLEEIDEMFLARLPAKKFRQYECTGIGALTAENESNSSISNVTDKKDEVKVVARAVTNPV
ncbi:general substrate transporter [Diaporthe sp. PMI_573]|nr:general substrate transporter [Diaporthaceae sp. PMI_573]